MLANPTDADTRWQAVVASDPRFDGAFVYAVRTTGIYCRPTCSARLPRPQNVRYYDLAAAAEADGFRPCKRCRPEPDPAPWGRREARGAVLFVDLVDSTRTVAKLSPLAAFAHLETFYEHVGAAVEEAGGEVHKLLGDGVLAWFERTGSKRNEAAAAFAVARRVRDTGRRDQAVRLGLHYGRVGVGPVSRVGSGVELVGRTVTVAKRLQEATKRRRCSLLVSDACLRASGARLGNPLQIKVPERLRLRGCGEVAAWRA